MPPVDFRAPTLTDADRIVALLVACDIADFGAPDYDYDALLDEWNDPAVDLLRDAFYAPGGAYGLLLRSDARAWVHPQCLGQGLGTALAERLEARARERGLPFIDQQVARRNTAGRALLDGRGYRLMHSMAGLRLPDSDVGRLPDPEGVRPYDPARDGAAEQALMQAALGGVARLPPPEALEAANPDRTLWFVADAPDGSLAGALRCELRPAGFITGYITQVAVAEERRGGGIGSALVGAAARELVARGAVTIRLHVRSSNPDALRLSERLGFSGDWEVDELRLEL
jgi:ribosomal protein S18 acetylase RimI-like enzyme